ncbi:MAG: restriction endonuclease subunit S [Methylocella sp.]
MRKRWPTKELGDVCRVVGGGTPPKDREDFYQGDIPWATVRDMRQEIISETEFKITEQAVKSSATNIIPANNVVIATRVGLGKVCFVERDTAINQDLRGVIPIKNKELLVRFLFWWFKSVARLIEQEGTGATVQGVKLPFIKSLPIPLPPLLEQQRIVAILDEAFKGIAAAAANAEKNVANARELFDGYLRSALSQRGPGWERKTLKEVSAEFGRGKSKHRPRGDVKLLGGQYPLIQTGDVANSNHHIVGYSQTYNEFGLAQSKLWPKGTVCIAIVGANVAETAILNFDACFPDSVIGLVVDDRLADNEYVEFLLQTFKAILKQRGKGTARDNINLATFENQTFPFPNVVEQRQIVARINDLAEQTQRLESLYQQKLDALAALKQSILQKAFAGELTARPEQVLQEAVA